MQCREQADTFRVAFGVRSARLRTSMHLSVYVLRTLTKKASQPLCDHWLLGKLSIIVVPNPKAPLSPLVFVTLRSLGMRCWKLSPCW